MGYFIPIWILGAPFVIGVLLWMGAPKVQPGDHSYATGSTGLAGGLAGR